ncbi:helix-turn-helix transcriptional regulator [Aliivibrio salmonicida]|uniref:helix-turn-helix transcriptional regulator n=1 Tax=Aliivibrio salmonicida TaxID=40269 RepID=UPI003D0A30EC
MNVDNNKTKKSCDEFKNNVLILDKNVIHLSFSSLNLDQGTLKTLSSDYDFHLQYWESGLYKKINNRIKERINIWNDIDNEHGEFIKNKQIKQKIDICTKYNKGNIIQLLSLASTKKLNETDILNLIKLNPRISYSAKKIWNKHKTPSLTFPYFKIKEPKDKPLIEINSLISGFSFGDVNFTAKEIDTISLMLELKSLKEIAWIHLCSETAERRRIEQIKNKLNCKGRSLSTLFKELKSQGINT